MVKKLVITGCGHSGTRYLNQVLREAGISSNHEYAASTKEWDPNKVSHVEVSWLAPAYVIQEDFVVWQVVRHPLKVARSFKHRGFFQSNSPNAHLQLIESQFSLGRNHPELDYWICWNDLAESMSSKTFTLEELDVASFVTEVAELVGVENPNISAALSVGVVGASGAKDEYDYSDYADLRTLKAAARYYGYTL